MCDATRCRTAFTESPGKAVCRFLDMSETKRLPRFLSSQGRRRLRSRRLLSVYPETTSTRNCPRSFIATQISGPESENLLFAAVLYNNRSPHPASTSRTRCWKTLPMHRDAYEGDINAGVIIPVVISSTKVTQGNSSPSRVLHKSNSLSRIYTISLRNYTRSNSFFTNLCKQPF
ncbi:hypothetical protein TGPRC2_358820 [Toxoplasma gondii TgCatPRC2]|uniref:Uncharacterized protein n=2 Tax=Toxoplasma gondii TaxID=5811 RepID=A0A151HHX0_TOXGO|nr:hypothetical protein TGARI_358820 [Toxoplasma gondii ARI]KYK68904.1 hypothetical protein TGPRC2_358820 [Toxoplasma gondii TgCatPRC2]